MIIGLIIVGIVPLISRAKPQRYPSRSFVASPLKRFRIGERLGDQRVIVEGLLPVIGQVATSQRQDLGS